MKSSSKKFVEEYGIPSEVYVSLSLHGYENGKLKYGTYVSNKYKELHPEIPDEYEVEASMPESAKLDILRVATDVIRDLQEVKFKVRQYNQDLPVISEMNRAIENLKDCIEKIQED